MKIRAMISFLGSVVYLAFIEINPPPPQNVHLTACKPSSRFSRRVDKDCEQLLPDMKIISNIANIDRIMAQDDAIISRIPRQYGICLDSNRRYKCKRVGVGERSRHHTTNSKYMTHLGLNLVLYSPPSLSHHKNTPASVPSAWLTAVLIAAGKQRDLPAD